MNEVELLAREPGCGAGSCRKIFGAKSAASSIATFPKITARLLKALVVGDMGGITKEMRAAFTAAGVNHVLSISGLHVAMLGLVVFGHDSLWRRVKHLFDAAL